MTENSSADAAQSRQAAFVRYCLKKRRTVRVKTQNGKSFDGKRSFLYVLARTKEQYIERMQVICQRNRPHGTCLLSMADLFSEFYAALKA